jgi:hypothetical protein
MQSGLHRQRSTLLPASRNLGKHGSQAVWETLTADAATTRRFDSTVPVETFADAAGFVRGLAGNRPFDIAVEGATERGTAAGHIAPYAAAGATWWVEAMGWWRGDLATARDRITAGPPA